MGFVIDLYGIIHTIPFKIISYYGNNLCSKFWNFKNFTALY